MPRSPSSTSNHKITSTVIDNNPTHTGTLDLLLKADKYLAQTNPNVDTSNLFSQCQRPVNRSRTTNNTDNKILALLTTSGASESTIQNTIKLYTATRKTIKDRAGVTMGIRIRKYSYYKNFSQKPPYFSLHFQPPAGEIKLSQQQVSDQAHSPQNHRKLKGVLLKLDKAIKNDKIRNLTDLKRILGLGKNRKKAPHSNAKTINHSSRP